MNHPMHSTETVNRHLLRRLCTYIVGLLLVAISTSLSMTASLGLSAFNSTCSVLSQQTSISMGDFTILVNGFMVVVQAIILRRHFQLINLAQIPFAFIYGKFIILVCSLMPDMVVTALYQQVILLLVSLVLLAVGILFYVGTELVPMPVEGAALVIASKSHLAFHNVKIILDASFLFTAIGGSLYFYGNLGVGVGTVILAFGSGWTMGKVKPFLPRWIQNWHLQ